MNFKSLVIILAATLSIATAHSSDLAFKGQKAILKKSVLTRESESFDSRNGREQIAALLDVESRLQTVGEAIDLKTRGLVYVQDAFDFDYLTTYPFQSPSDSYKAAVEDFIAQYVARYVTSFMDIPALASIESRTLHVNQAMAVKNAGLRPFINIQDYLRLIQPVFKNPSDAYLTAISTFTATNITRVVDSFSPIYLFVEVEKSTRLVNEAMAVKNAGLVAVRTQNDLLELARYSVANPSQAYIQAVNDFLRLNISRYPRN